VKRSSQQPRRAPATASQFRLSPVAAGATAMLMAMGAQAQQTPGPSTQPAPPAEAAQTITVTGIRRGIENAINIKKNADGVVEAISAEDIGKLPDTSIAESLARLPGLTTQRTRDGRASTISIRGLGADFNGYLLNGREQTSTGDSRAPDLSVYPAELIGGATVYKTGDAGLMAAGLAGTIDNKLVDPLSFSSRVIAVSAQKGKTGKGLPVEGDNTRYSISYIDQFADRKLGLALGFVRVDGTSTQYGAGGWGSRTEGELDDKGNLKSGPITLASGAPATGATIPGPWGAGLDFRTERFDEKRDGFTAIVAFKPSKELSSQLDFFYSKIKLYTKKHFLKGGLGGAVTNAVVDGSNVVTAGTYALGDSPNGLIAQIEGISDDDKISSLGWKTTWAFAPGWTGSVDLSTNTAKRKEIDNEYYAGIGGTGNTLDFVCNGCGATPKLTPGNATSYTTPATVFIRDQSGWSGVNDPDGKPAAQAGYSKGPNIKDKIDALRLDFRTELGEGMFPGLQFGTNFTKRTKDRTTDEGLIQSVTGVGRDAFSYPSGAYVETNVGGTGVDWLTFDPQAGLIPGAALRRKYNDDILSKSWQVTEKVTTLYGKVEIDTEVAKVPVRGNLGLQVVNTDQSSRGFRAGVGPGVVLDSPITGFNSDGIKYTDFLPTLSLAGDLGGGHVVRLGVGQQIARSTLTDLRNSLAAAPETDSGKSNFGVINGSAGNPKLKPFKAKALDLSYEKYFGTKGYFSVAGFYKKLDTYIVPQTIVGYDFASYAQELGLALPASGSYLGTFTTSVNGTGGNLHGIELAGSLPFNLLTSYLDGFGATVSYAETASSVKLPNVIGQNPNQQVNIALGSITLPGLSKQNAKLMLYFEKWGFSAFVAQNYRSKYIGSVANDQVGGYPSLAYIDSSSWVSAQIGYEVQDGPAKGLALRVEGNNLNKPVYRQLKADGVTLDKETKTGASIALKLSYKFQ
jgi:iron complex outermembrane recepter protein